MDMDNMMNTVTVYNLVKEEVVCSSSSSDKSKIPQNSQCWRSANYSEISSSLHYKTYDAQKIRKRRKPVMIKYRGASKKNYDHHAPFHANTYDHHTPFNADKKKPTPCSRKDHGPLLSSRFKKREITTIHEEGFHQTSRSFSDRELRLNFKKRHSRCKQYDEKVASLKAIVSRLQKMCVEKPQMLQDSLPDETIMLFKSIQI